MLPNDMQVSDPLDYKLKLFSFERTEKFSDTWYFNTGTFSAKNVFHKITTELAESDRTHTVYVENY